MVGTQTYKVKVKTGNSWVTIENVEICYYLTFKDFFDTEPSHVEIRYIIIPGWAEQWRSAITSHVHRLPSCLNKDVIEVV